MKLESIQVMKMMVVIIIIRVMMITRIKIMRNVMIMTTTMIKIKVQRVAPKLAVPKLSHTGYIE